MISLEKFKTIMERLKNNIEYLDKVCEIVGSPEVVYDHACIDETIMALAAALGCDEDILFRWTLELGFGAEDPECQTIEQLYECLAPKNPEEKVIFAIPSEVAGCPAFELTYHSDDDMDYYTMSMETVYQMDKDEAGEYVHDIWKQFTDWMIDNGHSIDEPVPLYVFESGVDLHTPYLSIADAYAAFTVLATGVSAQGVVGEW